MLLSGWLGALLCGLNADVAFAIMKCDMHADCLSWNSWFLVGVFWFLLLMLTAYDFILNTIFHWATLEEEWYLKTGRSVMRCFLLALFAPVALQCCTACSLFSLGGIMATLSPRSFTVSMSVNMFSGLGWECSYLPGCFTDHSQSLLLLTPPKSLRTGAWDAHSHWVIFEWRLNLWGSR